MQPPAQLVERATDQRAALELMRREYAISYLPLATAAFRLVTIARIVNRAGVPVGPSLASLKVRVTRSSSCSEDLHGTSTPTPTPTPISIPNPRCITVGGR